MTHLLEIDSVYLSFGTKTVLSDIFICCNGGKITGLLGRNGQGKSCLLNTLAGSNITAEKSIRYNKTAISGAFALPGLLSFLPQHNFIPGFLTVRNVFKDFKLDVEAFTQIFPAFALKKDNRVINLSGGDRRLVETYLIICADSIFSILDEPFTHLTLLQVEKIMELIIKMKEKKGFIITDHLYNYVLSIADHVYLLADGKISVVSDMRGLEQGGYINFPGSQVNAIFGK